MRTRGGVLPARGGDADTDVAATAIALVHVTMSHLVWNIAARPHRAGVGVEATVDDDTTGQDGRRVVAEAEAAVGAVVITPVEAEARADHDEDAAQVGVIVQIDGRKGARAIVGRRAGGGTAVVRLNATPSHWHRRLVEFAA